MQSSVAGVQVDTQPDGSVVVRWEVAGPPIEVDVATGPTPEHLDHRHETTVPAGTTTLVLPPRPAPRLFVSVAPHGDGSAVVAADRRIPFQGIQNFRDLGGYHTRDGGVVRWGLVFRADALHGLTAPDLDRYHALGLRTVYDLRGDIERDERPNPVPSRVHTVLSRPADAPPLDPDANRLTTSADGEAVLHRMYVGLVEHAADRIGELYTGLAAEGGLPAVFHCHAGKDRTGLVAALLLDVLGVDRTTVLDDYELTARYRLRHHQEGSYERLIAGGMGPEAAGGVLTTPRWAMQHTLDDLEARYGTVERYLTGPAGMRAGDVAALRAKLVAPPGAR